MPVVHAVRITAFRVDLKSSGPSPHSRARWSMWIALSTPIPIRIGIAKKFATLSETPRSDAIPIVHSRPTSRLVMTSTVSRTVLKSRKTTSVTSPSASVPMRMNDRRMSRRDSYCVIGTPVASGSTVRIAVTKRSIDAASQTSSAGTSSTWKRPVGDIILARMAAGSASRSGRTSPASIARRASPVRDRARSIAIRVVSRVSAVASGPRVSASPSRRTAIARSRSAPAASMVRAASPSRRSLPAAAFRSSSVSGAFEAPIVDGGFSGSKASAKRRRRSVRSGVEGRTTSSTLRTRPISGWAAARVMIRSIPASESTTTAANQEALLESSSTRCSHSTLSSPSACRASRLSSKRIPVTTAMPERTEARRPMPITKVALRGPGVFRGSAPVIGEGRSSGAS